MGWHVIGVVILFVGIALTHSMQTGRKRDWRKDWDRTSSRQ